MKLFADRYLNCKNCESLVPRKLKCIRYHVKPRVTACDLRLGVIVKTSSEKAEYQNSRYEGCDQLDTK